MQTVNDATKQPVSLPDHPFENANKTLFTTTNGALVNYHF